MIVISSVKDIDFEQYDEVWYITNHNPEMKPGAKHHPELAPFIGIYMQYRRGHVSNAALLNDYGNALWSGKYKEALDNVIAESEKGKWIQLVCYCDNYTECHRSVLYRYLNTIYDKVVSLDE